MIADLQEGEFVYVRMQTVRMFDGTVTCCIINPDSNATHYVPIPRSLIVCREPKAMEADAGIVRGLA